ncbi:MAG: patatin family protein [Agathobacter sp.]|nr:patatin family protein [Agathobacter sp.]
MSKIGLVLEGGGMKCAYSAGVLDCFLEDGIQFDYLIGVSAGSANGVSYLAGQKGRNKRFYTEHLNDKDYMGLRCFRKTGNIFGLDYIYSTLTNSDGADPLDYDKLMENPTEYELVATNALTGKAAFFSKENFVRDDYKEIKASCAIPAVCKPVVIDGIPYYDGGIADSLPLERAFERGCDKLVVITSKARSYQRTPQKYRWFYSRRCKKYPKIIQLMDNHHIAYMEEFRHMFELEKQGKVLVIAPSKPLDISTFTKDAVKNQEIYDLGCSDYDSLKQKLMAFMER